MTREVLTWDESVTGHFEQLELTQLRDQDAQTIIQRLKISKEEVVIWVLAELQGHGDIEKLRKVGNDPQVKYIWNNARVPEDSQDIFYLLALVMFFA